MSARTPEDAGAAGNPSSDPDAQTLADGEQTLADSDQTLSDADQTSSDSDQRASDEDQAASDRDLAAGVNPHAHESSRAMRRLASEQRDHSAHDRLTTAALRDEVAHARDVAARARDIAAAVRDHAMAQLDAGYDNEVGRRGITDAEIFVRAAEQRRRAAEYRAHAAEHRALAAQDREAGAADREQAARDRLRALGDRESLARELAITENDPLTGARVRAAGLKELDHELDRCRRTGVVLVVAYADVVGLKTVNDTWGHAAGDALLTHAVALIRSHLRPYDLVIRLGGDEFLCAMPGMTVADARRRLDAVAAALTAEHGGAGLRTGFAELQPDDTSTGLIARADGELVDGRRA